MGLRQYLESVQAGAAGAEEAGKNMQEMQDRARQLNQAQQLRDYASSGGLENDVNNQDAGAILAKNQAITGLDKTSDIAGVQLLKNLGKQKAAANPLNADALTAAGVKPEDTDAILSLPAEQQPKVLNAYLKNKIGTSNTNLRTQSITNQQNKVSSDEAAQLTDKVTKQVQPFKDRLDTLNDVTNQMAQNPNLALVDRVMLAQGLRAIAGEKGRIAVQEENAFVPKTGFQTVTELANYIENNGVSKFPPEIQNDFRKLFATAKQGIQEKISSRGGEALSNQVNARGRNIDADHPAVQSLADQLGVEKQFSKTKSGKPVVTFAPKAPEQAPPGTTFTEPKWIEQITNPDDLKLVRATLRSNPELADELEKQFMASGHIK